MMFITAGLARSCAREVEVEDPPPSTTTTPHLTSMLLSVQHVPCMEEHLTPMLLSATPMLLSVQLPCYCPCSMGDMWKNTFSSSTAKKEGPKMEANTSKGPLYSGFIEEIYQGADLCECLPQSVAI